MQVHQWGHSAPLDLPKFRRLVAWFSCGAASAVATKMALDHAKGSGIETVVAYTDPGSEHADNPRFLADVSRWLDHPITLLRSDQFPDTWAVWKARRYIAGPEGAPCTGELKKSLREKFEREGDLQVFGYDATEQKRIVRFSKNQPEVALWCPLADTGTSKELCFYRLQEAGIALPAMYLLGYRNNNCIGCPKGNAGYWNKIRRDFPDTFDRMAEIEAEVGAKICQATRGPKGARVRIHIPLTELLPDDGNYSDEPPISCGLFCNQPEELTT